MIRTKLHTTNAIIIHCTKKLYTAQKFFIKDFFSKCDQIRIKLPIWSHLLKNPLMENFIICAALCFASKEIISQVNLDLYIYRRKFQKTGSILKNVGQLYPMVAYFMDKLIRIADFDVSTFCLKIENSISCIKTQESIDMYGCKQESSKC